MTMTAQRLQVEEWMRAHNGVLDFSSTKTALGEGYAVKVGTIEVFVPTDTADQGVEAVRTYLQHAVPAAMVAKAEAMETGAAALRASAAEGVEIPPANSGVSGASCTAE